MPSSGMPSKVFAAWLHMICDLLANNHLPFLNILSIDQLDFETKGLSNAFHVSPIPVLLPIDPHELLL
jgi:hypothetical protein